MLGVAFTMVSFIQFQLATLFATREELGYNLTVVREIIDGEVAYDYLMEKPGEKLCWYRTVRSMETYCVA